jgi:hypothetical protein
MNRITRIITLLLLLLLAAAVCAEEEGNPRIIIHGTQDRPAAGSTWALTLLVAHSEPNEVEVLAPPFTGSLMLEQVLKSPRHRNPSTGLTYATLPRSDAITETGEQWQEVMFERWTAVEYRFSLSSPGTIHFDSFTVITPLGQATTAPFNLNVQRPLNTAQVQRYQLQWEGIPATLGIGENAVFSLSVRNWNSAVPMPKAERFLPPVPQGHILESLPVSMEEQSAGTALKLRLIPLGTSDFSLDRRQLSLDGMTFELPPLRIAVSATTSAAASAAAEHSPQDSRIDQQITEPHIRPGLPFPPMETARISSSRRYTRYRLEYETMYNTAKNLWERGYIANALVTLRQNERDHPAGSLLASIRREAESALGFTGTFDEKKRNLLSVMRGKPQAVILRETDIRHIPDPAGEIIGRFNEGQPVLITSPVNQGTGQRGSWVRVTANDSGGAVGWVPEESAIFY